MNDRGYTKWCSQKLGLRFSERLFSRRTSRHADHTTSMHTKRSFYKYQHTGFSVKNIEFFWFRNPYKGWFPFLVYPINKLLNTFHGFERFASIIGGIYELQCVMEKDQLELDFLHTPGAKLSK